MTKYAACAATAAFVATRMQTSMMRRRTVTAEPAEMPLSQSPDDFGERCQTVEYPTPEESELPQAAPVPNITTGAGGGRGGEESQGVLAEAIG